MENLVLAKFQYITFIVVLDYVLNCKASIFFSIFTFYMLVLIVVLIIEIHSPTQVEYSNLHKDTIFTTKAHDNFASYFFVNSTFYCISMEVEIMFLNYSYQW